MTLSDKQIERYSRQIIVSQIGGRGQERLLASRLEIIAAPADLQPALAYMVGAGAGEIFLRTSAPLDLEGTIARMLALNPDTRVTSVREAHDDVNLVLILASSAAEIELARSMASKRRTRPLILARLDKPGKIAIVPSPPPCPACADAGLLAAPGERAPTAGVISMVACVEALKTLAGCSPVARPSIIEFNGYESDPHAAKVVVGMKCPCAS
jgi:molybdopterin-synthase adenylyltransferase